MRLMYASQIKMKQNYKIFILILILMTFLSGCKNYQNEMFDWSSCIPIGTDLKTVKKDQPEFLEIDWENPDTLDNGMTRYNVTKIKRNYDILKMAYFLEFENNEFRGLFGHK